MAESYCEDSDVYAYGLARGSVPNPGRLVASVNTTANTIALDVHGFSLDDVVTFRAEAGGSLPAPLAETTDYYAIPAGDGAFKVAASAGGAAIDIMTAGERFIVIGKFPIAAARAWASRIIDDMLPAALVPLVAPYPPIITMTAAELAAGKLGGKPGSASRPLTEIVDAAMKRVERWAKGIPIRGENAPTPANLAASTAAPVRDPRGWNEFGGL